MRWMPILSVCVALCAALGAAVAAPPAPAGAFTDELDTPLYDCTVRVTATKAAKPVSAARLALEWEDAGNMLQVIITNTQVKLVRLAKGVRTELAYIPCVIKPNTPTTLTIMRRGGWIGLAQAEKILYRGEAPRGTGAQGGSTTDAGWTTDAVRVQRLEPVVFADNFMRTADETGPWTTRSGQWRLQSAWDSDPHGNTLRFSYAEFAQNPFAWMGSAAEGSGLCITGKPFWEDYTFSTAVLPPYRGAVGVAVNMSDETHGLLVRWSPANDRGPQGDRLQLIQFSGEQRTLLKEVRGGYVPAQWSRLSIVSQLGEVCVSVDGHERLRVEHVTPWRGGVGLYAEGGVGPIYDDVSVYGRTLKTDLIAEQESARYNEHFMTDPTGGMQEWAVAQDWQRTYGVGGAQNIHRESFYGDHWLSLTLTPRRGNTGQLWLALQTDGDDLTSGYRATLAPDTTGNKLVATLYRATKSLATNTLDALTPDEEYSIRFRREGTRVRLEVDGTSVVEATDPQPLTGTRPGYRASGTLSGVRQPLALGRQMRDYTFTDAPVDWRSEGTWMPTVRWSCSPQWSFMSGWSRGDAVLWHKQRFSGDQSLQAFMAFKQEYPRETDFYDSYYKYHDINMSICTDGKDPRTGYALMSGLKNKNGAPNSRTVLLRNGVEVASSTASVLGFGRGHREWNNVAIRKRGKVIECYIENNQIIRFVDEAPIEGGVPAVWTFDNGVSVARVRVSYSKPPEPRTNPQVVLDNPWYPEWADLKTPLQLVFPETWSTSGRPVQLTVSPRDVPKNSAEPTIEGTTVTFTPQMRGKYWYTIRAIDGDIPSPAYHLSVPVFDPARGRDDAHAILLYDFAEQEGRTVRDRSAVEPALNLTIPKKSDMRWLPGRGLSVRGGMPLMSAGAATKLMAIARAKACTLEFWLSTDSCYPPPQNFWSGCIMTWELGPHERNLAIGHDVSHLVIAPNNRYLPIGYHQRWERQDGMIWGFRTSLHHTVITWDGSRCTYYHDGDEIGSTQVPWDTAKWNPEAPLLLGNQSDGQRTYLGTYYLLAIHDCVLPYQTIMRHYQAGPSARWTPPEK